MPEPAAVASNVLTMLLADEEMHPAFYAAPGRALPTFLPTVLPRAPQQPR
jgi:hypothetical protein